GELRNRHRVEDARRHEGERGGEHMCAQIGIEARPLGERRLRLHGPEQAEDEEAGAERAGTASARREPKEKGGVHLRRSRRAGAVRRPGAGTLRFGVPSAGPVMMWKTRPPVTGL